MSFMCKASGFPQPEVSWSFKNGSLPPHSMDMNGNLTIPSVGNNNTYEGTYTCTATSRAGVATIDMVLTVHGKLRVLRENRVFFNYDRRGDSIKQKSHVIHLTHIYLWNITNIALFASI